MTDAEPRLMDWLLATHASKNIPVLQPPQPSTPLEAGSTTLFLSANLLQGSARDFQAPKFAMKRLTPSYARWAYTLCQTIAQMSVVGVYCSDSELVWLKHQPSDGAPVDPTIRVTPAAENVVELGPMGVVWLGHFGNKEARVSTTLLSCENLEGIAHASTEPWAPEVNTVQMRARVRLSAETLLKAAEGQTTASSG